MEVYLQLIIEDMLKLMRIIKLYILITIVYIQVLIETSLYVMDNLVMKKILILITGC